MYDSVYPDLDKTYFAGQTVPTSYDQVTISQEGRTKTVDELDAAAPVVGSESPQGARAVEVTLIRNVHATTCTAGSAVKVGTTDGHRFKRTAGMAAGAKDRCIGIVHHRLKNGLPQHDLAWVVTKGPCWANKITGALSVGDKVVATTTAGSVGIYANTGTGDTTAAILADDDAIIGVVIRAAASGDAQVEIEVGGR